MANVYYDQGQNGSSAPNGQYVNPNQVPGGGYNPYNPPAYNPYGGAPVPQPPMAPVSEVPTGKYAPLSPWAYFGYSLLFSIPLVGLICLIVFSFSDENINRRNFARSIWCGVLVSVIISVVVFLFVLTTGSALIGRMYY